MRQVVMDRLLGGRGVCWVRYEPHFVTQPVFPNDADGVQLTDDQDDLDEEQSEEILEREDVVVDYVHWQDFGHTWAKTWQEVRAVWRIVPMSRKELIKRFGEEIGNQIPMGSEKKTTIRRKITNGRLFMKYGTKKPKLFYGFAKITKTFWTAEKTL